MATGLIGEKAGAQPRAPGQPRRSRPVGRPGRAERPGRSAEPQGLRPAGRPAPAARPAGRPGGRPGPAGGPAGRPGLAHPPAAGPAPQPAARGQAAARAQGRPRTPFVLLLVGLLGGGLVCLLLINTTLAQGSFQITAMQQQNASLTQQVQALQQQTTQQESPASIAARARQLGMQPVGRLRFIDLKSGRISSQPAKAPDVPFAVPGYTP